MRIKSGPSRRHHHKKILKLARGYKMARRRQYHAAKEAVLHAGVYAYHGRRLRKRDFRRLWIQRINAALTDSGMNYNRFIHCLKTQKICLDRKILADLAVSDPDTFKFILSKLS